MSEFSYSPAKTRSRLLILNHITQFSLSRKLGDRVYGGLADMAFEGDSFGGGRDVVPGDLVVLQSAPASKYYLSWFVSRQRPSGWCDDQFTLESIEDGELCNWTNVGLFYYNREQVSSHPEWRWTDKQHEFNDRWHRTLKAERDAYIYLPCWCVFDADAVTLQVRIRFGFGDPLPPRKFQNWRKVTKKMMLDFYDEMVALDKSRPKKVA